MTGMDVSSETLNFFYEGTEGIILFYYLRSFDGIDTFVRTFVRSNEGTFEGTLPRRYNTKVISNIK